MSGTRTDIHVQDAPMQTVVISSWHPMKGATSVTLYFPQWFPFDPEAARQVGHFDRKLDTGGQSLIVMPLLPRAKQLAH